MHVMRLMNKSSSIYSVHMRYFVHGNLKWSFTHLYGDDAGQGLACVGSSFNSDTQSAGALRHSHQSWHGLQQSGLSESRPLHRGKQKDENSMNWESSARQRHKRIRVRLSWRALPSETWQPNIKKTKQIPFTIISKGDNLYFYHSLCKAVFSVYTHKAELAFSAVRSPFVCFFLMADEMKTKGSEWETNIKHDISTHILNHSSDTRTSLRSFRLFFLSLSDVSFLTLSLCFSRSHRFHGAPLPSPCTLSHWPSSGRTWTALLAQASRLCDVHAAVLAQRLSAVGELRQGGSCGADTYTSVILYYKVEGFIC